MSSTKPNPERLTWQDIVIGLVLVAAVGVDTIVRRQRA